MNEGVYAIKGFLGLMDIYFGAVKLTDKAFAFYPLDVYSEGKFRVMTNPEPLLFSGRLEDMKTPELDDEDSREPLKEGELEDIINLNDYV